MTVTEQINLVNAKTFLTIEDAAFYLNFSKSTVYKLCSTRKISFFKPNGKENFFKKEDLDTYLLSTRVSSRSEIENQLTITERQKKLKNKRV